MSLREVLKYPHPFLRERAGSVPEVDDEARRLLDDMVETMRCERGLGLAATQVGVARRLIVLCVPAEAEGAGEGEGGLEAAGESRESTLYRLVNPEIIGSEGEIVYEEGCLSLPGITADVKRPARVIVRALGYDGRPLEIDAGGLLSVALQHEIDHLDGILFIDRLSRLKRELLLRRYRKLMAADAAV